MSINTNVKNREKSYLDIVRLLKKSDIFFIRSYNGIMIPALSEMLGVKNEKDFFFTELLAEVRKNKVIADIVPIGRVTALVSKEFYVNFLSLVLERSSKNGVYKQLSIRKYTKFERDLFETILEHGPVSKKTLTFILDLTGKKSRRLFESTLSKLWESLLITRVGYKKTEGSIWQAVVRWDQDSVRKALKIEKTSALEKIVLSIVQSCSVITRSQIKRLLKNAAASDMLDQAVTNLIVKNKISVHPEKIINGKKGLVAL
jgi:hypothetical protein